MNQWQYSMFQFENGQVAEPANPAQVNLMQALAMAGRNSWELVAVLAVGPNTYEFIFKRPLQVPEAQGG